uniref:Integrase catalytic domain-containing protein n=1 Tax=Strongyloides venezuelensis TaxID=75913 RepID=A0A0K0FQM9_STRVS
MVATRRSTREKTVQDITQSPKDKTQSSKTSRFKTDLTSLTRPRGTQLSPLTRHIRKKLENQDYIQPWIGEIFNHINLTEEYIIMSSPHNPYQIYFTSALIPFEVTDSIEGFLFNLKEAFRLDGISREDVKIHMCRQKLSKEAQYRIGYQKYATFEDMMEIDLLEFREAPYNYKYLLVAVDHFSNFTWIKPLRSKKQGPVTEALKSILTCGVIPTSILSDNGLEFCNAEMKRLCKEFHIEHLTSEPHRPKGHGAVERKNRQIRETVEKLELARKKKWPLLINEISHALNSTPDKNSQTPYEKFSNNFREQPILKASPPRHQWKPGMKIMIAHRRPVDSKPWRNTGPYTILDTDPTHLLVSKDDKDQEPSWIHHERAVPLF